MRGKYRVTIFKNFAVHQKLTQHCKSTILQLKIKNKEIKIKSSSFPHQKKKKKNSEEFKRRKFLNITDIHLKKRDEIELVFVWQVELEDQKGFQCCTEDLEAVFIL